MVFVGLLKAMPGSPTDYPSLKWYQTAAAAGCRGFSQTLLGKPEVFPYQMGYIIPPVSLNVITGSVPSWMGLKTLQKQPLRWAG